jgi:hypothetical protein
MNQVSVARFGQVIVKVIVLIVPNFGTMIPAGVREPTNMQNFSVISAMGHWAILLAMSNILEHIQGYQET